MYEEAIKDFDIDLSQSFVIGDKIRDCAICEQTDCRGFLIANNEKSEIIEDVKNGKYKRVNYQSCLLDCAKYIINQNEELDSFDIKFACMMVQFNLGMRSNSECHYEYDEYSIYYYDIV